MTRSAARARSSTPRYRPTLSKSAQRRPLYDPALDALQPALSGRLPVAFEAEVACQILRALDMTKVFKPDPIITNGREAD